MKSIKIVTLFSLLISLQSSCSDKQFVVNDDDIKDTTEIPHDLFVDDEDNTISGLHRGLCMGGKSTFVLRSQEDYDKNKCTLYLKKVVDYLFCENRDSYCISNQTDPRNCTTCCCCTAAVCGVGAPISKLIMASAFTDPANMDRTILSRFASNFSWFPSCTQQYNCGDTLEYNGMSNCCGEITAWGSSFLSIFEVSLLGCLFLRQCLKEKKKNSIVSSD